MINTTDFVDFSMNRLIMFVPFPGLLMRPQAIDPALPHGKAIKDERDCKLQASANCCPLDFSPSPLQSGRQRAGKSQGGFLLQPSQRKDLNVWKILEKL